MSSRRASAAPSKQQASVGNQSAVTLRAAGEADVPAITEIFNQGVEDGMATLDPPHTVGQRVAWFREHGPNEPVIVAEGGGRVVGWASLSRWSTRMCYDTVKELSIYVRREWRGKGVGEVILARLLKQGQGVGLHKAILFCFPENAAGVKLYRKLGFVDVGVFRSHGVRNGVWHDILAMERQLADS